jgi:hypothetical protein
MRMQIVTLKKRRWTIMINHITWDIKILDLVFQQITYSNLIAPKDLNS